MDILNLLQRVDGKRALWKTGEKYVQPFGFVINCLNRVNNCIAQNWAKFAATFIIYITHGLLSVGPM